MIYENGFVNKAMLFYKSDTKKNEFSINKFNEKKKRLHIKLLIAGLH